MTQSIETGDDALFSTLIESGQLPAGEPACVEIVPTPGQQRPRDRLAEEAGSVYERFTDLLPMEFVRGFASIEAAVDETLNTFGQSDPEVRAALIRYLEVELG
jgi:hypothetical protein